jgi:uncharacterized membrane protein
MAYCTQCGVPVGDADRYCAKCGAPQASAGPASSIPKTKEFLKDVDSHKAALLCYIPVLGWIPALIVLAAERFRHDRFARFHAFQGLYLFVGWLIVDWVIEPIFHHIHEFFPLASICKALLFGAWIFMIIKASHKEFYKLPFVGELAERSVSEQR